MAKSLRCKAKNAARRHKRETGEYHIHHAARLDRLNARLLSSNANKEVIGQDQEQDEVEDEVLAEGEEKMTAGSPTPTESTPKISTSGPRGNRRETWRESKGMKPRVTNNGMNAQGKLIGNRRSGRPGRRR